MNFLSRSICVLSFAMTGAISLANAQSQGAGQPEIIPHRTNPHQADAPTAGSTAGITPAINYNGGPVLRAPTVYLIWYGSWQQTNGTDTANGQNIIRDFLYGLSGSPYYMINASYTDPHASVAPSGSFQVYASEYTDTGPQGSRLSDAKVKAIVSDAISSKHSPADTNGFYFVLTSSDINESSGFCTKYCGWHTSGTITGSNIKYAFVGNGARCLNACAAQKNGPNGNAGVDAMVSVIAHELEETNTDPVPNTGWADSNGSENADKCGWTFGQNLHPGSNGSYYNMTLPALTVPSRPYLIQRNLSASDNKCYLSAGGSQ
ncbi:MAG: hypothetical protein ACJ746_14695 [Bryobacteraceae bacterium]